MNVVLVRALCNGAYNYLLIFFGRKPARHNHFKFFVLRFFLGRNKGGVVSVGNHVKFALVSVRGKLVGNECGGTVNSVKLFVKSFAQVGIYQRINGFAPSEVYVI